MKWTASFPAFARWRPGARSAAIAVCIAGVVAAPARAQRLLGTVVDSGSSEPVRGAVLTLTDTTGKFLARSIADASGHFTIPRLSGAARLNATRIGYRPRSIALSRAPEDSTLVVRMVSFVSLMDAVATTSTRVCPGEQSNSGALELWEQARAGLLSTVVAREKSPPNVRLFSFALRRNPVTRRVIWDSTDIKDVVVQRSYVAARPAWVFAAEGYMREITGGDRTYYAPDEETLLDPTFAETHCLRAVGEDKTHLGQVGIAFEPVRGDDRDTLVDVTGVLWMDSRAPKLRSLEFTYTGLEPDARGAGGDLRFFTTPAGVAMVERWTIHTPMLAIDPPATPEMVHHREPPRTDRMNVRVLGYSETGGEVVSARWPDGGVWHGNHPRIVGSIKDKSGAPMRAQRIWIVGGKDTATSRPDGSFEFPFTMPGVYLVLAADSGLARHGLSRTPAVAVRLDQPFDYEISLVEYPRDDVLTLACPAKSYRPGTGVLIGTIVDGDGDPVREAHVEVVERPTVDSVAALPRRGEAGFDGKFVVCGASLKWPLHVRAEKDGAVGEARIEKWTDDVVELTITLRKGS